MPSFASRYFVVTEKDQLLRMPSVMFKRLLANPAEDFLNQFCDKKVRFADIVIELNNGQANKVIRTSYYYLYFNSDGTIDNERFLHQGGSLTNEVVDKFMRDGSAPQFISPSITPKNQDANDAIWWQPKKSLEKQICSAAINQISCPQLLGSSSTT